MTLLVAARGGWGAGRLGIGEFGFEISDFRIGGADVVGAVFMEGFLRALDVACGGILGVGGVARR